MRPAPPSSPTAPKAAGSTADSTTSTAGSTAGSTPGASADVVVWSGRHPDAWPDGLDSWRISRAALADRLDRLPVLVLLDPLSFPWPMFIHARRSMPVVACLPDTLDARTLGDLLGGPLLSKLTPVDRLVEQRADVRAALEREWGLDPVVWLPADLRSTHVGGPDDAPADTSAGGWRAEVAAHLAGLRDDVVEQLRHRKEAWFQLTGLIADELLASLNATDPEHASETDEPADDEGRPRARVAFGGRTDFRWRAVETATGARAGLLADLADDDPGSPSPDAAVLVLDDGGQPAVERRALLAAAHAWLQPGGVLVVVGHVVDGEGGPNPRLTDLVAEIHDATGTAVHLQELRSVRWLGEPLSRGVVLRFTSLRATDS